MPFDRERLDVDQLALALDCLVLANDTLEHLPEVEAFWPITMAKNVPANA